MATIVGSITINEISICEIVGNPASTGLDLPTGSLAIDTESGRLYSKTSNGALGWTEASSQGAAQASDIDFSFDGSISVRQNSFCRASSNIGYLVNSFSNRILDVVGSFTVNQNGRIVIGNDSSVTVRSN